MPPRRRAARGAESSDGDGAASAWFGEEFGTGSADSAVTLTQQLATVGGYVRLDISKLLVSAQVAPAPTDEISRSSAYAELWSTQQVQPTLNFGVARNSAYAELGMHTHLLSLLVNIEVA